jgi:hypothetical protein
MEMQTRRPDGSNDVRPSDRPIEVAAPQRSARGSSENQRIWTGTNEGQQMLSQVRDDRPRNTDDTAGRL